MAPAHLVPDGPAPSPVTTATVPAVPARVLDLFAVPDDVRPLPGGRGGSVVAGDLVLSPGRDATTQDWLSPVLARLAVGLDLERPRAMRIAMPIPSRAGSWVVDGWAASRYEPDTAACSDLDVLVATGRVLHARLDVAVRERPAGLDERNDPWARADRLVWGPADALAAAVAPYGSEAKRWVGELDPDADLGPDQLVHGDLAGNVLLDAHGTPVVIDLAPYWRPALWAEAVCVLDAVTWHGADPAVVDSWSQGRERQAMLRARLFRLLSDPPAGHPTLR